MLFHKSIVSFVAAITLATVVAAAATPPLTGTGSSTQPEGSSQNSNQQGSTQGSTQPPTCSPGLTQMCCESSISFANLSDGYKASLKTLDPNLNQNLNVGQHCAPADSQGCGNLLPLCCDAVQSADDLPNLAPSCVIPTSS